MEYWKKNAWSNCRSLTLAIYWSEDLMRLSARKLFPILLLISVAASAQTGGKRDLPPLQRACAEQLERLFREAGVQPPDVAGTVGADANREAVCRLLVARGRLVRLGRNGDIPIFCHRDTLARARQDLASAFPPPATFTASQARERLGATRRFVIPLLEFLEAERCMVRRGPLHAFLSAHEPSGNHPPSTASQTRR